MNMLMRSPQEIREDIDYLDYESQGMMSHREYVSQRHALVSELYEAEYERS